MIAELGLGLAVMFEQVAEHQLATNKVLRALLGAVKQHDRARGRLDAQRGTLALDFFQFASQSISLGQDHHAISKRCHNLHAVLRGEGDNLAVALAFGKLHFIATLPLHTR